MTFQRWVEQAATFAALAVQLLAIAILVYGSVQAFVSGLRVMCQRADEIEKRVVWLHFAQWLSAGLTFQLAADLIETSVSPSWAHLGKLAAVAAIRTGLAFSLERDRDNVRRMMGSG